MRIGVDIDEVLVELVKGYLIYYEQKFGVKRKIEDAVTYHLENILNISIEKLLKTFDEYYDSKLFEEINLIEGSVEAINKLAKKNKIYFITARPLHIKDKTTKFLEKTFPEISYEVYYSGDFHGENKTKAEICLQLGIDIMIEDYGGMALACARVGIRTFLLDKPWNKTYGKHPNLIKVSGWKELMEKI